MEGFFDCYDLRIGEGADSPFVNRVGVYQDGTTPMFRDVDGTLWAMSGHTHMGEIAMFAGSTPQTLTKQWAIETCFSTGNAAHAFAGIPYPEGIAARGSIWPFGLFICPNTHRFFCWFHNETGWNGDGSAYDAFGPCKTPKIDSDFRHVGLMHSDDEGRHWSFDRWVLAAEEVAFTERYNPGAGRMQGQKGDLVRFGSGDFSLFVEPEGDYIYLFYNIIMMNLAPDVMRWEGCDVYVARCRKREDGAMGDFVKYYDGSFCESGIFGKETPILRDMWHPRVVYCVPEQRYFMTGKPIVASMQGKIDGIDAKHRVLQLSQSTDLIHWSEPQIFFKDGAPWGNHYHALVSDATIGQPHWLTSCHCLLLHNHNGTDVTCHPAELCRKGRRIKA